MTQRARKNNKKHAVQVGANRGGNAFAEMLSPEVAEALATWSMFDTKPGRATDLAARVQARFPGVRTEARRADGRDAVGGLATDAVIVGTVDTIESTRALVGAQHDDQTLCFQLVGRGPGPAITAGRLGFSGVVRNPYEREAAGLLLDGFGTISAAASSRALTAAGDPMSAAMLQPMRIATTRQTVRYFADAVRPSQDTSAPLTFFTSNGQFPLTVLADTGEAFSLQKARALAAIDSTPMRRVGIVAAVALIGIEERFVDILFVSRSREDHRRVIGVTQFRAPSQRHTSPAVWSD